MLKASGRRGSTAREDHKRKGFTCRLRQPTIGISYTTASTVSAGCQTERFTPVGKVVVSTEPPKRMSQITSGRANSQGLPKDSQSSGSYPSQRDLQPLPQQSRI